MYDYCLNARHMEKASRKDLTLPATEPLMRALDSRQVYRELADENQVAGA